MTLAFISYSSFRSLLMYGKADCFNLFVFAFKILYFFSFLIFMLCFFLFRGNIIFNLSFMAHFLANCRHSFSLLFSKVSSLSIFRLFFLCFIVLSHYHACSPFLYSFELYRTGWSHRKFFAPRSQQNKAKRHLADPVLEHLSGADESNNAMEGV